MRSDSMKIIDKIGIIFLGILVASGCAQQPVVKTVTQIEFKAIDLPEVLLKPCHVTEPPDQAVYLGAPFSDREEHLTNYIVELLGDLKVCNSQISQLKLIRDEQIKAYAPKSSGDKP